MLQGPAAEESRLYETVTIYPYKKQKQKTFKISMWKEMINGYYKMQSFLYSCRPVWVELLFSALHGREYLRDLISLGDHRRQI